MKNLSILLLLITTAACNSTKKSLVKTQGSIDSAATTKQDSGSVSTTTKTQVSITDKGETKKWTFTWPKDIIGNPIGFFPVGGDSVPIFAGTTLVYDHKKNNATYDSLEYKGKDSSFKSATSEIVLKKESKSIEKKKETKRVPIWQVGGFIVLAIVGVYGLYRLFNILAPLGEDENV